MGSGKNPDFKYTYNYEEPDYEFYKNMILCEDGNYYPKRPLPVGVTSFTEAMNVFCYVDKTMMIEELLKSGVKVSLFTRPRRFGKTTNMDMLRVFLK